MKLENRNIEHRNRYALELLKQREKQFSGTIETIIFGPKGKGFDYEEHFTVLDTILVQIHSILLNNFETLSETDKRDVSKRVGRLLDEWNEYKVLEQSLSGAADFLKPYSNYLRAKGTAATKERAEKLYKITERILKHIESSGRKLPIKRALIEDAVWPHWPKLKGDPPKRKTLFEHQRLYLESKG